MAGCAVYIELLLFMDACITTHRLCLATEPARRDKGDGLPQLREENILSDVDDGGGTDTADPASLANEEDTRVCMESFSASWSYQSDRKVLHDITFEVNRVS